MNTIERISSAQAVEGLLSLVGAADPILDTTYGNGTFWHGSNRQVIGCDGELARATHLTANFCASPFRDGAFPTVVYDPPFHPYVKSAEEGRYRGMGSNARQLRALFCEGLEECWRVARVHLLVKCQGFIHDHAPQWMPLWAIGVCGEPFEWLVVERGHKRISGRWRQARSLRRNHADYLLFCKNGNRR